MDHWYVIHTKPRKEEHAADHLERQGFEIYLPKIEHQKRLRGKWKAVIEPLFSRYLFIHVDPDKVSVAPVRSTLGVNDFVRFGGVMCEVPDQIISMLKSREQEENGLISPDRERFIKGDEVEITEGPFAGLRAAFEQDKGADRALILLELMGKLNRVTVQRDLLLPVT